MDSVKLYGLCLLVAGLNVTLNYWAQTSVVSAGKSSPYLDAIVSWPFLVTFCVGLCSVLCMIAVYRSGVDLPKAIALMGAASIVGGAVFYAIIGRNNLGVVEWLLIASIAFFYAASFYSSLKTPSP